MAKVHFLNKILKDNWNCVLTKLTYQSKNEVHWYTNRLANQIIYYKLEINVHAWETNAYNFNFLKRTIKTLVLWYVSLTSSRTTLSIHFLALVKTSSICTRFIIWGYKCASLTILIYLFTWASFDPKCILTISGYYIKVSLNDNKVH